MRLCCIKLPDSVTGTETIVVRGAVADRSLPTAGEITFLHVNCGFRRILGAHVTPYRAPGLLQRVNTRAVSQLPAASAEDAARGTAHSLRSPTCQIPLTCLEYGSCWM